MPKILIIDDEAEIRTVLREIFEFNGYEVIEAGDGNAGVRQFEATQPDLVISDIVMPDQEGIFAIMEIRKKKPGTKIIAMSGGGLMATPDEYLHVAQKLGADLVFMKPLDLAELLKAVRTLLA
jgi:DNA-binding response OmpR family regulator